MYINNNKQIEIICVNTMKQSERNPIQPLK